MNCSEAEARLNEFVDRELSEAEVIEVQHHLDSCPPCLRRYRFESHLRRVVRLACSEMAPDSLRARILDERLHI
ncbi:MAG: hypothetical protein QOF51_1639 [Chloroflexota bacterium]|jgi:mycothiol system anti-sigma-R factor|nr:hypothetical protein [Chloroflexota bacterium]